MNTNKSNYLLLVSFVSTIGGFLFGYDTAIISGCNSFLEQHFTLSAAELGWIVSSALLGTIFGCLLAGGITDRLGRKKSLIVAALCLTLSALGSMLPPQFIGDLEHPFWITAKIDAAFHFLIIVRIIGGIGVGITSVVAPIYISELSLPESRGRMVSLYQLSITLGILLAFMVDWIVLSNAGDAAGIISEQRTTFFEWIFVQELWRGMFGTEVPIAIMFLTLLLIVPKSPRWLISKKRYAQAKDIMVKLYGIKQAELEMAEIKEMPEQESNGFIELKKPYLRIPLLIGILLPMFSHLSGIAAIMYFAPNIINESVDNVESSFLGAILVGVVNCAFTFVAIFNIEKFGRRKLLLVGVISAFISLSGVGLFFALGSAYVIIPLLLYVASFAFSYGPIVWVIISEIFPTRIRGLAVGIGSFVLMFTGFLVTLTNPILIEKISPSGTFFIYAALTVPAIWFIWKFVPETKGKTLEQIEKLWLKQDQNKNLKEEQNLMIETYYTNGQGYSPFLIREGWQVAQLNFMPEQDIKNITRLDRHNLTDEAFILLKGKAVLVAAEIHDRGIEYHMELLKPMVTYNIPKKVWHNIVMKKDCEIIIVEKSNTHIDDFEHYDLGPSELELFRKKVKEHFQTETKITTN
ncbi:sugar porter family MFS transporter [Aestuariivivens insulae]|jgi:SP family arabinose:H+ symporter-like MFS transporter|uniref:sugar porter family MFS transporter n=1 Tax=Aestuariivivens insulae TaxID=1621988 RepID=UPI001F571A45|nr:sugar porter family MFS transporter [Aestuariivivens insulae]